MNKFLITLATIVAFASSSVAYADVKISGFLQQIAGMGDEVDGGLTHKFTRFSMGADTTTDNGWTVGGSFALEMQAAQTAAANAYLPSSNSMYIQTDMGTVTIGASADALTSLVPRVGNMVPGGGHDAGYQFLFNGGNLAANGVPYAEAYYAQANHRINVALPSINGFSVAVSYTPGMEFNSASDIGRNAPNDDTASHGETSHVAVSYSGEMDGISYTIGAGSINGNSQANHAAGNSSAESDNNDLAAWAGAVRLTMGNMSIGAHIYDNGDSFGAASDAVKASESGYTVMATYNMGNLTVGAGMAHQELVRGTRAQALATTLTGANAGNVREDNITMVGIGYNMGGGVSTYIQLNNMDHTDGDHATTEVDPQVLFAGISLGF
jgi:hypothetical protein